MFSDLFLFLPPSSPPYRHQTARIVSEFHELLSETSVGEDGRPRLVHERLVKARRSLVCLVNTGMILAYLDPGSSVAGRCRRPTTASRGRQRAAQVHARGPQGALDRTQARGGVLVVLHALTKPAPRRRGPARDADGPLHRRRLRQAWRAPEARGDHPEVGATPSCGRSSTTPSRTVLTRARGLTHFFVLSTVAYPVGYFSHTQSIGPASRRARAAPPTCPIEREAGAWACFRSREPHRQSR